MTKRIMGTAAVAVLVGILAGCTSKKEEEVTVPVKVAVVDYGTVIQSLAYSGEIQAEFEVKVFAKIPDRIEKFYVDIGSRVAAGAPIAKIYAATLEQGVLQAEGGVAATQAQEANVAAEYARAERLYKENATSQQQYDAVRTQYEAAKAQLQQAQAALASVRDQLDETMVKAPISGIVGERYCETGDMANPAVPLVRIVQMERVKLVFQAAEQDLGKLAMDQDVEIRVKSYPDLVFKGRIQKISPVLDPMTRMARVEVLAANPGARLKPGMYAEAEVKTGTLTNVLTLPRYSAIESTSMENTDGRDRVVKNYFVFVVNDSGKAERRLVDVRYIDQVNIAVNSGVARGEKIVVSGQSNLRDGMSVTPVQ